MRNKKMNLFNGLAAFFLFSFVLLACNNNTAEGEKKAEDTVKKTEQTPPPSTPDSLGKKDTLNDKPTETGN